MTDAVDRASAVARQVAGIGRVAEATPPPSRDQRRSGEALRALTRYLLASRGEEPALARVAATLEELVGSLGAATEPGSRFADEPPDNPDDRLVNAFGSHPLLGDTSPMAPPIRLTATAGRVIGEVTYDVRFEGNEGWVHGGFVAAGFDIVAVQAARLSGRAGPTGTLEVRFTAPTPIGVPLRYEGWFDRAEGRKLFAEGELRRLDDGSLTAAASAIVVARR